jgi:hypothetical protein
MIPKEKERRSYIRGDFSFQVKFRIMSPDECRLRKRTSSEVTFLSEKKLKLEAVLDDSTGSTATVNASLVDFLVRMDEKLDQILSMLMDKEDPSRKYKEGLGVDISATGMGILTDMPVVPKQSIQADIILSRMPLIRLNVMGEIVQVIPATEDEKTMYHIGVRFVDLNANDKEKIIKCVLQNERAVIRERKRQKELR